MKYKVIIIIVFFVSGAILSIINRADYPDRYLLWQDDLELNSSHFLKLEPLYNFKYAAAILPAIKLRKKGDSIYAVTIIDTHNSWLRDSQSTNKGLLRHELYHANITEIYTRMLNKLLAERKDLPLERIYDYRKAIQGKANQFQEEYDKATNHGLISHQQNYWEYKIDSMLYSYPRIVDYYSGVSLCFPAIPKSENFFFKDDSQASKYIELIKYGVEFKAMIDYDYETDSVEFLNFLISKLSEKTHSLKTSVSSKDKQTFFEFEYTDTSKEQKHFDKFLIGEKHLYYFSFSINQSLANQQEFLTIKDNYFNSIRFHQYNNYWIEKYNKIEKPKIYDIKITDKYAKGNFIDIRYYSKSDKAIAYHTPIFNNDHYVIPFEPIRHEIDEIDEVIFMINSNYTFMQNPNSVEQFIRIDVDFLRKGSNEIIFGYTLKSDKDLKEIIFYQARAYITLD